MSLAGWNVKRDDQTTEPEPIGIGGFKAYAVVNEGVSGTRQLPTSTLEDGSYANDHVIIDAITLSLSIEISDTFIELDNAPPENTLVENLSGSISQFVPARTAAQTQRVKRVTELLAAFNSAKTTSQRDAYNQGAKSSVKTHRENFVQFLHDMYNSDGIISIETQQKTFDNMCLSTFDTITDNRTKSLRCELQFQQLDFRELQTVAVTQVQKKVSPAGGAVTGSPKEQGAQGAKSGEKADEQQSKSLLTALTGR